MDFFFSMTHDNRRYLGIERFTCAKRKQPLPVSPTPKVVKTKNIQTNVINIFTTGVQQWWCNSFTKRYYIIFLICFTSRFICFTLHESWRVLDAQNDVYGIIMILFHGLWQINACLIRTKAKRKNNVKRTLETHFV